MESVAQLRRAGAAPMSGSSSRMWDDLTQVRTRLDDMEDKLSDAEREHAVHVSVCAERYLAIKQEQERTIKLIRWVLGLSAIGVMFEMGRASFPELMRALIAIH